MFFEGILQRSLNKSDYRGEVTSGKGKSKIKNEEGCSSQI